MLVVPVEAQIEQQFNDVKKEGLVIDGSLLKILIIFQNGLTHQNF